VRLSLWASPTRCDLLLLCFFDYTDSSRVVIYRHVLKKHQELKHQNCPHWSYQSQYLTAQKYTQNRNFNLNNSNSSNTLIVMPTVSFSSITVIQNRTSDTTKSRPSLWDLEPRQISIWSPASRHRSFWLLPQLHQAGQCISSALLRQQSVVFLILTTAIKLLYSITFDILTKNEPADSASYVCQLWPIFFNSMVCLYTAFVSICDA